MSGTNLRIRLFVVMAAAAMLGIETPRLVRAATGAFVRDDDDAPHSSVDAAQHHATDKSGGAESETGDKAAAQEHESTELKFDEAAQKHLGIVCELVKAGSISPTISALGIVEEDASRLFTLRAPLSGYLRPAGSGWPSVGTLLKDDAAVGALQPRLTPIERFALENQVTEAKANVAEIESEQAAAEASYAGKRKLNEEGKVVSDRQFEEADAKRRLVQARLEGARAKLEQLQAQRNAVERGLDPLPLHVGRGGAVLEVLAVPGEAVESGQPLLRILAPGEALARVELPLGTMWTPSPSKIVISPIAYEAEAEDAGLVGLAPRAGARTRGQAWMLRTITASTLSPGTPIVAHLPIGGESINGIVVAADAILRYGGLTWVFVREDGQVFERHSVQLIEPTRDGWLVQGDLEPGAVVVTRGAQLLLSEQLKAQIEAEAEASE